MITVIAATAHDMLHVKRLNTEDGTSGFDLAEMQRIFPEAPTKESTRARSRSA